MTKIIENLLCWWVSLVQRNPIKVIVLLIIASIFSGIYGVNHFAMDSDLDRLIKQNDKNQWYVNSLDFWRSFPDYHRNIIVVVSGKSATDTYLNAEKLYFALHQSQNDQGKPLFDDVFAPVFDDFIQDHIFYNIPSEGVRRLSLKVQESLPDLAKVYHQPDVPHLLTYLQQQYDKAADLEVFMPDVKYQLSALSQTLEQLQDKKAAYFRLVQALTPPDDGKMAYQLIVVKRAPHFGDKLPNQKLVDDLHRIIKQSQLSSDVQVRLTGEIALMHDEVSSSLEGFNLAGKISIVLLLIVLGIGVRSKTLLLGMFIQLGMGVLFSVVFTLAVYGSFNTLTLVFVIMLFGMGIDFAVHFSLRQLEVMRSEPDIAKAGLITVRDTGVPTGICALTTAVSFASFYPTEYTGLAQLGIVSAFGMVAAYALSLTFIPAWMVIFKIKPPKKRFFGLETDKNAATGKGVAYPAKTVLFFAALLFIVAVWYVHDTRFNYNLLSMHNQQSETITTLKELQKNHLINPYALSALVAKGTDLQALKEKLLALPSVSAVQIPQEHLPLFQSMKQHYMQPVADDLHALGAEGQAAFSAPEAEQSIKQFLAALKAQQSVFVDEDLQLVLQLEQQLSELLNHPESWPLLQQAIKSGVSSDVKQLNTWFSAKPYQLEDMPDDIKRRLISPDGRYLVQILPSVDMSDTEQNRYFIKQVMTIIPNVTGLPVYEWGVGQVVVRSFYTAITIAMGLIFVIMAVTFRNLFSAVFIFIPMILVVAFTLAFAKMIGMSINMANVLVVPLIFGLGVDTGIHVLHRYHLSSSLKEAIFSSTGKAALLSALTTISSFVAISFSDYKGAASIGILLTAGLSLIVIVTFVVLPALLTLFDPKKKTAKRLSE